MVSLLIVPRVWHIKLFLKGQWWCSVGRVVASDSRDTRFESSHRQKFILNIYCRRYWKDENKEKNYMICNCPLFMLQNLKKKGKITLTASRRNPSRSRWSAPPTRHWWSGRSCLNVRLCGVVEIACWNLRRKLLSLFAQLRSKVCHKTRIGHSIVGILQCTNAQQQIDPLLKLLSQKIRSLGREPWSGGYERRLMFMRLWVQIPVPYAGWIWHFFMLICGKNCSDVWKDKNKRKRGRGWPI